MLNYSIDKINFLKITTSDVQKALEIWLETGIENM